MPNRTRCRSEALNPHSSIIIECYLFADHPAANHMERNGSHTWNDDGKVRCNHLEREELAS